MAVSSESDLGTTEIMAYLNSEDSAGPAGVSNQPAGIREALIRRAFEVEGVLQLHLIPSMVIILPPVTCREHL